MYKERWPQLLSIVSVRPGQEQTFRPAVPSLPGPNTLGPAQPASLGGSGRASANKYHVVICFIHVMAQDGFKHREPFYVINGFMGRSTTVEPEEAGFYGSKNYKVLILKLLYSTI